MKTSAVLLLAAALAGCTTMGFRPRVIESTPELITLTHTHARTDEAQEMAREHCAAHGRQAVRTRLYCPSGCDSTFACAAP